MKSRIFLWPVIGPPFDSDVVTEFPKVGLANPRIAPEPGHVHVYFGGFLPDGTEWVQAYDDEKNPVDSPHNMNTDHPDAPTGPYG